MCGIGLYINCEACSTTVKCLDNRGPDTSTIHRHIDHNGSNLNIYSSVLSHQGAEITHQPIFSKSKDLILLWNGEVYDHPDFDHSTSDTVWLMNAIEKNGSSKRDIMQLLSQIRGEFAFLLINLKTDEIMFGRDRLGRRSLLFRMDTRSISITSVSPDHQFIELPADGIYIWKFDDYSHLTRIPYPADTTVDGHRLSYFAFRSSQMDDNVMLKDLLTCKEIYNDALHNVKVTDELILDDMDTSLWVLRQNASTPDMSYERYDTMLIA